MVWLLFRYYLSPRDRTVLLLLRHFRIPLLDAFRVGDMVYVFVSLDFEVFNRGLA